VLLLEIKNLRNQLDQILDDYEYCIEENKLLNKLTYTYVMMKDLILEMNSFGDLESYDVEDILNRIEEMNKLGL
jgi:hypothetical protein